MPALRAYLKSAEARRFDYGKHDCALFAAGWVLAATGRDLTLGIRYSSLREGLAALAALGHADHVAVAAALLPEIPPARARRGDIATLDGPQGAPVLAIVLGERIVGLTRHGLRQVPLSAARRAFRVAA